jgi:hypothetical protein
VPDGAEDDARFKPFAVETMISAGLFQARSSVYANLPSDARFRAG